MEKFCKGTSAVQWVVFILCLFISELVVCSRPPTTSNEAVVPQIYELCGQHYNGRRIYLEAGRSGLITASNVQLLPLMGHPHAQTHRMPGEPLSPTKESVTPPPQECRIELVACPSCVIEWKIIRANISLPDHIELTEPPYGVAQEYTSVVSGRSVTRDVLLRFVFTQNYEFAFDMQIDIKRNRINITEDRQLTHDDDGGELAAYSISTPFFPLHYPRDYEVEYTLQCASDECHVRVNFMDFHLAPVSVLEIIDFDGERVVRIFTGLSLRPRIFVSTSNSLLIRFNANGGIGAGFNAEINFIPSNVATESKWNPDTDCGGYVDRLGGAITMMQMTNNDSEVRYFDCIWVIRPSNKYYHMKSHQSLQLASFSLLPTSLLTIRRGMSSRGELLGTFSEEIQNNNDTFVAPVQDGYYIQMKGNFTLNSTLALVFTVFSYTECYMGSDFMCANQKCIPIQVHCDGFDHCGDGSDEPPSCAAEWNSHEPFDRQWYKFIPNYYFPSTEYDFKAASILFISTSAGLIVLLACLFLVLYRINVKARHQRELQHHLQTISELLDHSNRHQHQVEPEDEPPIYEAPPEYEEVIKVGMDKELRRSRRRQREERRRSKQPILDPEPDDGHATPAAFVNRHTMVLTEPFPIETAAADPEAAAAERTSECNAIQEGSCKCSIEELNCRVVAEDQGSTPPPANGFLIVFQNDEPTAVPFDHRFSEEAAIRDEAPSRTLARRFSADPLLPQAAASVDVNRSFRV